MDEAAVSIFLTPTAELVGIWVAALLTLAVYSFLYADTPLYKIAEHLFVGISAAYGAVILYYNGFLPKVYEPLKQPLATPEGGLPNYLVIIPVLLGLMIFGRFFRGYQWTARWPIAFVVGFGAGAAIPVTFQANILKQTHGTIEPFMPAVYSAFPWPDQLGAWVLALGVVTTLAYFYFSAPHQGWLGKCSKLGLWFLMVAFGAAFGNTVMARVALLIGRVQFLLYDWIGLVPPGGGP